MKGGSGGVGAVVFKARDDEIDFCVAEELPRPFGLVGEVDEDEVGGETDGAGHDAFNLLALVVF